MGGNGGGCEDRWRKETRLEFYHVVDGCTVGRTHNSRVGGILVPRQVGERTKKLGDGGIRSGMEWNGFLALGRPYMLIYGPLRLLKGI